MDCLTCTQSAQLASGALAPREAIATDGLWRVAHAFNASVPGWLVLLPLRHVTSIAELTDAEAAGLGAWQVRLSRALTAVTGCVKTYVAQFAEAEGFSDVHFHVIPRAADHPASAVGPRVFELLGAEPQLTPAQMDALALRLRTALSGA